MASVAPRLLHAPQAVAEHGTWAWAREVPAGVGGHAPRVEKRGGSWGGPRRGMAACRAGDAGAGAQWSRVGLWHGAKKNSYLGQLVHSPPRARRPSYKNMSAQGGAWFPQSGSNLRGFVTGRLQRGPTLQCHVMLIGGGLNIDIYEQRLWFSRCRNMGMSADTLVWRQLRQNFSAHTVPGPQGEAAWMRSAHGCQPLSSASL